MTKCCVCGGGDTSGVTKVRSEEVTFGTKILATGFEELTISGTIIGLGLRFDPDAVSNDLKAI